VFLHAKGKTVHSEALTQVPIFRNILSRSGSFCTSVQSKTSCAQVDQLRVELQVVRVANLRPTMLRNELGGGLTPLAEGPAVGFVRCDWIGTEATLGPTRQ
jgi:hypothetical protein